MKRPLTVLVAAATVLAAATVSGTSAEAAAGDTEIWVKGTITAHDDDGWFLDPSSGEEETTSVNESVSIAPGQTVTKSWQACAGWEVKVVYTLTAENLDNGRVRTQLRGDLYEGATWGTPGDTTSKCPASLDHDGQATGIEQIISAGTKTTQTLQVDNQDDGGDWGKFAVTIENDTNL